MILSFLTEQRLFFLFLRPILNQDSLLVSSQYLAARSKFSSHSTRFFYNFFLLRDFRSVSRGDALVKQGAAPIVAEHHTGRHPPIAQGQGACISQPSLSDCCLPQKMFLSNISSSHCRVGSVHFQTIPWRIAEFMGLFLFPRARGVVPA